MPIHFGTDGWRAVISDSFTFGNLRMVAQAIADAVAAEHWDVQGYANPETDKRKIIIGFDTRFLSDRYASEVARVLAANRAAAEMFGFPDSRGMEGTSLENLAPLFANALAVSPGARHLRTSASTWAKRRDGQANDVEAIEQILAESAILHELFELGVRGRDDADVDGGWTGFAEWRDLT